MWRMSFAQCWKLEPPQPHQETSERVTPTTDEMNNSKTIKNVIYQFAV